jgi:predicted RNA-binding Zn-ribbon protein involved in translation (DUF1610 family)
MTAMKLMRDYMCPHCGATVVLRAKRVTVPYPSWCPRSRTAARSRQRSSDQRGRCTICGCQVPVAAGHQHPLNTPLDDLSRYFG